MSTIEVDRSGATTQIALNRPDKRNAINEQMLRDLNAAFTDAANDSSVHCVVVKGNGQLFSAGADLKELQRLASSGVELLRPFRKLFIDTWNLLEEMNKPTIAQLHGGCIGGALELALACDLRVASESTYIGIPETKVGLIPDVGGSSRLPSVVGLGRAKELIMTSKIINGVEAERIGLVNRLAGDDAAVDEVTQQLVAELLSCAPLAVGQAKRVMDASAKPALMATLELEVAAQATLIGTADFAEGTSAALEKRQANFQGH